MSAAPAPARMGTRTARSSWAKKAGVAAFVDDRDRDQCNYLGGALVCAGDDCLSLLWLRAPEVGGGAAGPAVDADRPFILRG